MAKRSMELGQKAPELGLENQDRKEVRLEDLLGQWVVLYFYPKDNTPGCTTEACEFTDRLGDFEKLNARVVGVSPDLPESHRKFREKHGLKLDLLSDPGHEVMEEYGAWGQKLMYGRKATGVIRSTVVLDPKGMVRWHWARVRVAGHAEQVRKKLAELQSA